MWKPFDFLGLRPPRPAGR